MLSAALLLLSNSLFLSLRLTGNPGSFPRPLPPEEERACLERWAQGDLEARNRLVEHNLRLVAHIIKKYYTQADNQEVASKCNEYKLQSKNRKHYQNKVLIAS